MKLAPVVVADVEYTALVAVVAEGGAGLADSVVFVVVDGGDIATQVAGPLVAQFAGDL